jgi:hypothetical protein
MTAPALRTFSSATLHAASAAGDPLARAAVAQVLDAGGAKTDLLRAVERAAAAPGPAADFLAAARAPLSMADARAVSLATERLARNTWITGVVSTLGAELSTLAVAGATPDGPFESVGGTRPTLGADTFAALEVGGPAWRAALTARLVRTATADTDAVALAWRFVCQSHGVRAGLARLGVPMSPRRATAHQRAWALLARLHGVPAALIAASPAEEALLASRLLTESEAPPSPEEVDGWLDALAQRPPCFASRTGLLALGRHIVGSRIAATLALPDTGSWQVAWTLAARSAAAATPAPAPWMSRLASA